MRGTSAHNGSTGNILTTTLSSSPPDKSHFKRDMKPMGPRTATRQFRSLLSLNSTPKNNLSASMPVDYETSRNLDMSTELFRDSFAALHDMQQKGVLCDMELKIGTRSLSCHKVVLCSSSKYFRSMFTNQMRESRSSVIELKDLDANAVESLLVFAYTGHIKLHIEDVQALFHASSYLQFDAVAAACSDFMRQQLHPSNCIEMRKFAEQNG